MFAVILALSLHGQTMDMKASIPFDFWVGETLLPAGTYTVGHLGDALHLKEEGGHSASAFRLTNAEYVRNARRDSALVFNRYGDTYFLAKVLRAGMYQGRVLRTSPREREVATRFANQENTTIALRVR
jgi:hypothetical protein